MDAKELDKCPGCGKQLSQTMHVEGQPDPVFDIQTLRCVNCDDLAEVKRGHHHIDESRRKTGAVVHDAGRHYTSVLMPPQPEKR